MASKFRIENNELVIYVSGSLTFHQHQEGEQLVHQVSALLDKSEIKNVRMNFADVLRMDSHWLGVLIRILRRVKEKNADFIIEKPNNDISRLFDMVELNRITEIRA
ncbi:MAG: STAS domain-containing protein [Alphaproteobacteria bacterium]|nr:STAS domain-containing protein [Alphaproteobacteria bacterium]